MQVSVTAQTATTTGPQLGASAVTVPANQVWVPLSVVLITTSIGAGDTGRGRSCLVLPGVGQVIQEMGPQNPITSAFGGAVCTTSWNFLDTKPRFLPAGTIIAPYVELVTVTTTGALVTQHLRYLAFGS